jgi:hypothetical protein
MQQQNKQLAPTGVIQTCRQHGALQILGGDDKLAGHQLVTRRLSDARFAPPEIWQQAADALSQNPRQHPGFEQLAVSKAIEEFSCQYFLLTPGARRRRSETLRIAATPYFHLTWRLQRLNAALDFDASLLTELSPPNWAAIVSAVCFATGSGNFGSTSSLPFHLSVHAEELGVSEHSNAPERCRGIWRSTCKDELVGESPPTTATCFRPQTPTQTLSRAAPAESGLSKSNVLDRDRSHCCCSGWAGTEE